MAERGTSVFWDDLEQDLQDPEFRHHYLLERKRIAAVDRIPDVGGLLRQALADGATAQ